MKEVFSQVHPGINDSKLTQDSMSLLITGWLKYGQLDDNHHYLRNQCCCYHLILIAIL